MDRHLLAALPGETHKPLLRHGEHSARAECPVVAGVGGTLDGVRDRRKDKVAHQFDDIAGSPVFARLLVVLLVEAADKLLENRPHRVVVETGMLEDRLRVILPHGIGRKVDVWRHELGDDRSENVRIGHRRDLVAKLELLENLLDVRREAVEIRLEVRLERLRLGAARQVFQAERRSVAERLPCGGGERWPRIRHTSGVQLLLKRKNLVLRVLQNRIETADHRHRKNHVAVLPAHIHIPKAVIRNRPDEPHDGIVVRSIQPDLCRAFVGCVFLALLAVAMFLHRPVLCT